MVGDRCIAQALTDTPPAAGLEAARTSSLHPRGYHRSTLQTNDMRSIRWPICLRFTGNCPAAKNHSSLKDFQRRFWWTLTEGKPAFATAVAVAGLEESEVLGLAASLDQGSEHPLAAAIVTAARQQGLALSNVQISILRPGSAFAVSSTGSDWRSATP